MDKIILWIKKNRLETFLLLLLFGLTLFLRFYRLEDYMVFLGDEGRDAIVIKKMLTEFDFPLLGPVTSVGNMYLGPLYYYMMAVPMSIFWLNPAAAAGMVALIGTLTVGLIFFLAREWFGKFPGLAVALLYSVSPITTFYSKSSWNPNPAPFFSLLALLSFYLLYKQKNPKWLILSGISAAFLIQMHYLALILIPVLFILWLLELKKIYRTSKRSIFLKNSLIALGLFLLLMSPLLIFDLRHNFLNYRAVSTFFTNRETTVNLNFFNSLYRVIPIFIENMINKHISVDNNLVKYIVTAMIVASITIGWIRAKINKKIPFYLVLFSVWLGVGLIGLSLYKQTVYPHYLGFLNPLPYFLIGYFIYFLSKIKNTAPKKIVMGLSIIFVVFTVFLNLQKNILFTTPNNQLKRTQEIAKFIIQKAQGSPFNFALLAEHNYDAAYQYYLDLYGRKPKQVPFDITKELWVVCEDNVCEPVGHHKYEIAAFGWSKIEEEYTIKGLRVFKLIHNPDQPLDE